MGFGHKKLHAYRAALQHVLQVCGTLSAEEDLAQYAAGIDPDTDVDPATNANSKQMN
jgi:hypothetical protein